jgi:DNA-binding transcriptional MerR regulator
MWLIDFAEDFSGLKSNQIHRLVHKGILRPSKSKNAYYFSYTDIYVLRIFRILKREGLSHLDISNAYEYLKEVDSTKPLSSFSLFHDGTSVITIMDPVEYRINASKHGQLNLPVREIKSIGPELEGLRCAMIKKKEHLDQLAHLSHKNSVALDDLESWLAS